MEKFLIIDGNNLAFRAYYALPFLTNSSGQPTGAVFGFMNMFLKVLEECQPTYILVAFDFSRKTFRNQIFADYKGTRSETPEDLRSQFPILKTLLKQMGIKVVEKEGIEADDIIGSYAKNTEKNISKIILSGDRDLLQLIDEQTEVWLSQKGITEIHKTNQEVLFKDFGVTPLQIIDLKALMGDSSDNIPGVSGIGPKTATSLISEFKSVENLYNNLESASITPKLREKLILGRESAFMSKILATIKTDCCLDYCLENLKYNLPFSQEVTGYIKDLDMSSLLRRTSFFVNSEKEEEPIKVLETKILSSLEELKAACPNQAKQFAFNVNENLIFSFGESYVYKIESEITLFSQPPELVDCLEVLKPYFENESVSKIVSNYKAQKHILSKYNIKINGDVFDINLANYLLGNKPMEETQVDRFFGQKILLEKDLVRQNLDKIYYEMEFPLEEVLYDMEEAGIVIDKTALAVFGEQLNNKLKTLTKNIYQMTGDENFNISSPKQLATVLFEKLHLPDNNNPSHSTAVDVLNELVDYHPVITQILEYRKVQKLKTTYVDAFLNILNQTNSNKIHTIFNQTLATTGRLSSSEPNLQNIPVRDSAGKELRKAFISRFKNGFLVSADYNQIELRLLAHLSGDEKLVNAFNAGEDVHTQTAMEIFGLSKQQITPEIRRNAKAVNFGIIYGITSVGLAENTGLSRRQAQDYIQKYFEIYPDVKKYMDNNVEFAQKSGYAKTMFGRKRRIPELKSENAQTRQFGARVAKNMPLQGSASDIIKFAMLKVHKKLNELNLRSKLILQVHDELVIDCPQEELDIVKNLLKSAMENVVNLAVKLPVDVTSGPTYFDI